MKNWNLLKHTFFAVLAASLINYLWGFVTISETAAIGIIGGADGPTSIFISGKGSIPLNTSITLALLSNFSPGIIAFILIMLLFKPVRKFIRYK